MPAMLEAFTHEVGEAYDQLASPNPGSDFDEPGFATWGLDRDVVLGIARGFGQEAVFELTPVETRIVYCDDGRIDAHPRLRG